jgi:hypothetical protein
MATTATATINSMSVKPVAGRAETDFMGTNRR